MKTLKGTPDDNSTKPRKAERREITERKISKRVDARFFLGFFFFFYDFHDFLFRVSRYAGPVFCWFFHSTSSKLQYCLIRVVIYLHRRAISDFRYARYMLKNLDVRIRNSVDMVRVFFRVKKKNTARPRAK